MKKAWIENSVIRDICLGDPNQMFHPDLASMYTVEVPDNANIGDGWVNDVLMVQIVVPVEPPVVKPPKVDVITYKMLFTSAERIATKMSTDPVIIDLQDLMNDPRTVNVDLSLKSVQDALDYMTYLGILAEGRKAEILTGQVI